MENPQDKALINIKIFLVCLFSYLLIFWLFPIYTFIALFLIVALLIVSIKGRSSENIYIGFLVGVLGGVLASIFLTVESFGVYMSSMPADINPDIPMSFFGSLFDLIKLSPLAYMNSLLFIVISGLLSAVFTLIGNANVKNIRTFARQLGMLAILLNFLFITIISSTSFAEHAATEPPNLSYAYDAIDNIKTVYLMENKNYYRAHTEALFYDARRNAEGTWSIDKVKSGISRLYVRQPFIFYFWKYLSMGDASRVIFFSILSCCALLTLSLFAAKNLIEDYALVVPLVLSPFMFSGTIWANVFFPDWWAGLLLFAAFLFWIQKRYWLTSLFILFAMLTREVVAFSYAILVIAALVNNRQALKPLLLAGFFFGIFYIFHFISAGQIMGGQTNVNVKAITQLYSFRLIPTSSYLMFLYGFFKVPAYFIMLAAALLSIAKKRLEFILISIYAILHSSVAASSYWGNHYNLIVIFLSVMILHKRSSNLYKPTLIKNLN